MTAGPVPAQKSGSGIAAHLASDRIATGARHVDDWTFDAHGSLRPIAIDIHPTGVIAGIEGRRHRLFLLDAQGAWMGYGEQGQTGREISFADRVCASAGLKIFVLDPEARAVDRYDLRGSWETRLDLEAAASAAGVRLDDASDFCLDPAGNLFVLDAACGCILHFDAAGAFLQQLTTWGDWQPVAPLALEVDGRGNLYLLETRPPAVMVLDPSGQLIEERRWPGSDASDVRVRGLAVDAWGNAFLGEERAGGLWALPPGGGAPWMVGLPGEPSEQRIHDVAVGFEDRLLIADAEGARVRVFQLAYRERKTSGGSQRAP